MAAEKDSRTCSSFSYPFAAAPDIIRSNQKDTYFQGVLFDQLSDILRKLYGARFTHRYGSEAQTFTELLYLGLTTVIGNRTLGEEYTDVVQIEDDTHRLPAISRRTGYVLSTALLPYALMRILPALRRRVRLKLESNLRRLSRQKDAKASLSYRLQSYLHTHLADITSPSPLYAISLTTFYFTGAYYHLGKRLFGLRYIFTRNIKPNEQRVGYEVLGILLFAQMLIQAWTHVHGTIKSAGIADVGNMPSGTALLGNGAEVSLSPSHGETTDIGADDLLLDSAAPTSHSSARLEASTHTPISPAPRYQLTGDETMAWIAGSQQRKCTLCLEPLKDPSATTCGHIFCWTCIQDWVREKPECPLCRQGVLGQHVLPLRS